MRVLKWIGISLGALLLAAVLWYLFIFDWNDIKAHLVTWVGDRTEREFAIDGDMDVRLSWAPRVRLHGVRLQNAEWSKDANMVEIERLEFAIRLLPLLRGRVIIPELHLDKPRLRLERNEDGVPNWEFATSPAGELATEAAVPEQRGEMPIIGELVISDGLLVYRDAPRKIDTESVVNTAVGRQETLREAVRVESTGHFEDKPFKLVFEGGSLLTLREEDDPYPLRIEASVGDTRLQVDGTARDPFRGAGLHLHMAIEGNDLSEVFPIFGIPLPPTRPYTLSGQLTGDDRQWRFSDFKGKVGESDLAGSIDVDFNRDPPFTQAQFVSQRLNVLELAGFFGVRPQAPRKDERLIPDTPINLDRLRAMDMEVDFRGEKVIATKLPADTVRYHLRLKEGKLSFDPLTFGIAAGTIEGAVHLDSGAKTPHLVADLNLRRMELGRFLPSIEAIDTAEGRFGGRLQVDGRGNSLREIFASADGGLWLSMSGGAIDRFLVAAAGLDVAELLRLLGTETTPVPLRCSVAAFDLKGGVLTSQLVILDAEDSTVVGEGDIDLRDETVDLRLEAHAKEPRPLTLGGAVAIEGPLKGPEASLDLSGVAEQAGAAALLATVLAPLAAIIPFIEPGVTEDRNCKELFAQAAESVN